MSPTRALPFASFMRLAGACHHAISRTVLGVALAAIADEQPDFSRRISSREYLADVVGPVQIHHGAADQSVPYQHGGHGRGQPAVALTHVPHGS
jgi:hypothetical protein